MKIYNYNLWYGECEILNVESLVVKRFKDPLIDVDRDWVVFMSSINSFYDANEDNYSSHKSFKELSVREIEILRKEFLR